METHALLQPGAVGIAFGYLAATLVGAMAAVGIGGWVTRAVCAAVRPEVGQR